MGFGEKDNDLPLHQFQSDWNKSIVTLLAKRAREPPDFFFEPDFHRNLSVVMSDGTRASKSRMSFAGTMSELRETEEARTALSSNLTQRLSMAFSPGTTPQTDKLSQPRRRS